MDELAKKNLEKNIANWKKELEMLSFELSLNKQKIPIMQREKELSLKANTAAYNHYVRVTPDWEFEKDKDYLEALRDMNDNSTKAKQIQYTIDIHQQEKLVQNQSEQVEQLSKLIKEKEEEVSKND